MGAKQFCVLATTESRRLSTCKMHLSTPVALAAIHSKAVVLLLSIYCLMYFSLFVGVLCFSFVLLCITLCPF